MESVPKFALLKLSMLSFYGHNIQTIYMYTARSTYMNMYMHIGPVIMAEEPIQNGS